MPGTPSVATPTPNPTASLTATHPSGLSLTVTAQGGLPSATQLAGSPYGMLAWRSVFSLYNTNDYCNLTVKCVIIECLFFTPHLLTPDYKVHENRIYICSVHYFIEMALPTLLHLDSQSCEVDILIP